MPQPLLTIIIPTYKRSRHLEQLLHTLHEETIALGNDVVILVSDNASPDDTQAVVARAAKNWPALISYRHDSNIGPDKNFCFCVSSVQSRWFWIIGDDDLPKPGVLPQIISLLRDKKPALTYMQSEWLSSVHRSSQEQAVSDLHIDELDADIFAKNVHIWVTYISGMVIDAERLRTALQGQAINRFDGSYLVQLGWVLPLLKTTGPFLFIHDRCMLATKDNSGGYSLLKVFGINFSRIVNESFGENSRLARTLIGGAIAHYLPGLIWEARRIPKKLDSENPWPAMDKQLGTRWLYWLLLVPLGRFPIWLAQPFFQTWRVINRLQRELGKHAGIRKGRLA